MKKRQYGRALLLLERGFEKKFPNLSPKVTDYNKVGKRTPRQMAQHFNSMSPEMQEFLRDERFSKFDRWLGFAQGVAWAAGVSSLNELRKMNMPAGKKFVKK